MNFFKKEIYKFQVNLKAHTVSLLISILLFIGIFFIIFNWYVEQKKIYCLSEKENKLKIVQLLREIKSKKNDLEVKEQVESIKKHFRSYDQSTELDQIMGFAKTNSLKVVGFSPFKNSTASPFEQYGVESELIGEFSQLMNFVANIQKEYKAIQVDQLELGVDQNDSIEQQKKPIRMKITFKYFGVLKNDI
jgi:hypothetical protein